MKSNAGYVDYVLDSFKKQKKSVMKTLISYFNEKDTTFPEFIRTHKKLRNIFKIPKNNTFHYVIEECTSTNHNNEEVLNGVIDITVYKIAVNTVFKLVTFLVDKNKDLEPEIFDKLLELGFKNKEYKFIRL